MFPCHNFSAGPYPFSRGFLDMQQRRRQERIPARAPYGGKVTVPEIYWDDLRKKKPGSLCEDSGAVFDPPDGYIFRALKENVRINMAESCLESKQPGGWKRVDDPFLELMTLVYLLNVKQGALQGEMIGVQDLKDAHFFQGPHQLKTSSLIARYGHDPDKFKLAGQGLGGSVLEMADAAVCLTPFPKIPVYYVLWAADEEFPANLSILFDKSIERHLSADAIWGIVAWVSDALVNA